MTGDNLGPNVGPTISGNKPNYRLVATLLRTVFFVYPALLLLVAQTTQDSSKNTTSLFDVSHWIPGNLNDDVLPVALVFYPFAFGFFVAGFMVPKIMLRGDASPSMQLLKTGDQPKRNAESKKFLAFIIRLALFEMIATLGFAIAIITSQTGLMIPFVCVAWLGLVLTPVSMVATAD